MMGDVVSLCRLEEERGVKLRAGDSFTVFSGETIVSACNKRT